MHEFQGRERYAMGWLRPNGAMVRFRPTFPRTREEQEERMTRFIEWKREQLAMRWMRRAGIAAILVFGAPLAIAIASWLWRLANASVLG